MRNDLISRQAAIDIERNATVDTNPSHFEAHQKFMQFMDDAEISSFGRWQWSNGFNTALTAVGIGLKKLPSAQPEPKWIPCSERMPEERDWYLGIFQEPDTGWINPLPFICDYLLGTKTKATTKEGWILRGFTDREEYIDYYFNLECVAWMPLPQPWKGEQNG